MIHDASADRPAILAVVALVPPTIENAEVERTVRGVFRTARSARLERPSGIVQPDVGSLHEITSDIHVVILDEDDAILKSGILRQFDDILYEFLALRICRMSLAGDDHLDRGLLVVEDRVEAIRIAEDERCTLVGRDDLFADQLAIKKKSKDLVLPEPEERLERDLRERPVLPRGSEPAIRDERVKMRVPLNEPVSFGILPHASRGARLEAVREDL